MAGSPSTYARSPIQGESHAATGVPPSAKLPEAVVPGATGPAVRQLQETLIGLGLISATDGNRDGVYGAATQEVVRQFQQSNGLVVDAKVGPQTWGALFAKVAERRGKKVSTG